MDMFVGTGSYSWRRQRSSVDAKRFDRGDDTAEDVIHGGESPASKDDDQVRLETLYSVGNTKKELSVQIEDELRNSKKMKLSLERKGYELAANGTPGEKPVTHSKRAGSFFRYEGREDGQAVGKVGRRNGTSGPVKGGTPEIPGARIGYLNNKQLVVSLSFSCMVRGVAAEEILGVDRNIVSKTLSNVADLVGPAAVIATFLFGAAILFVLAFCIHTKRSPPRKFAFVAAVASVSWWLLEVIEHEDNSQKQVAGWVSALLWAILVTLCAKGLDDSDVFLADTLCVGGLTVMGIVFLIVAVKTLEEKLLDHNKLRLILSFGLPPLNGWTWFQFRRHLSRERRRTHWRPPGTTDLERGVGAGSAFERQFTHSRSRYLRSPDNVHINPYTIEMGDMAHG